MNLMIRDDGAYGDQGFKIPALMVMRPHFEQIWEVSEHKRAEEAMRNTGLIDGFVIIPDEYYDWTKEQQDEFMLESTNGIEFEVYRNTLGSIAGRLNFHEADLLSKQPVEWKRELNEGRNYFDELSWWLDVPEAVGLRPATDVTAAEIRFLRSFRAAYGIPENAFLLGWQFTGSNLAKRIPGFKEVVQEGIMRKHPMVYVVGMGDLKGQVEWDAKAHGGRFINMRDLLSFREAYLATSIMDCFVTPNTGVFIFSQCFPRTPKILISNIIDGHHCCCGDDTVVLQSTAECSPCYDIRDTCKMDNGHPWFYCTGKIKPRRIINEIEKVIDLWHAQRCLRSLPRSAVS